MTKAIKANDALEIMQVELKKSELVALVKDVTKMTAAEFRATATFGYQSKASAIRGYKNLIDDCNYEIAYLTAYAEEEEFLFADGEYEPEEDFDPLAFLMKEAGL